MGAERKHKEYEKHTFHSSVNRIPRLPNEARSCDPTNSDEIYQQGRVTHLDHLHSDKLSGYFDLRLTARSPLLIGEQTIEEGIHYLQVEELDGKPYIAPTMIKGLLSATYERITSSRFRIFDTPTHVKPLTYRTDPSQSLKLTPVRYIEESDDGQQLTFEILNGGEQGNNKLAHIPIWYNENTLAGRYSLRDNAAKKLAENFTHGEKVRFSAYKIKRRWIVSSISRIDDDYTIQIGKLRKKPKNKKTQDPQEFIGYLYITTAKEDLKENKTNFEKKWAERIFIKCRYNNTHYKQKLVTCSPAVAEQYYTILRSYQEIQKSTDERNKTNDAPLITTHNIFARMSPEKCTLTEGTLAYAVIDEDDKISELIPITVGRHAYSHSPLDIAERDNVRPAKNLDEASAADRLFGFVSSNDDNGTALRGRIKVDPVSIFEISIARPSKEEEYKLLPPLLSPKPSSGRRFLIYREDFPNPTNDSKHTGKHSDQSKNKHSRSTLFDPSNSSLGEAAYPTHRSCRKQSLETIINQYVTSGGDLKLNESIQLHVRSWIREGSILSCRVHFEDISPKELAFLLWPLIAENLAPEGCSGIGYHKLGIGKPLGFGLVEVEIADKFVYFQELSDVSGGYSNLTTVLGSQFKRKKAAQLIKDGNIGDLTHLPSIRAFQRIAYGFKDDKSALVGADIAVPVRYINLEENKVNNATDRKGNPLFFKRHSCHAGRAPQALWGQSGSEQPDVFLSEKKSDHDESNDRSRTRDDKTRAEADKSEGHKKRSGSHTQQDGVYSGNSQRDTSEKPRKRRRRRRSRKH